MFPPYCRRVSSIKQEASGYFPRQKMWMVIKSMVMILVLFGNLFSATFMFVRGGEVISDLLIGGDLQPAMILFIMLLAIFLLGVPPIIGLQAVEVLICVFFPSIITYIPSVVFR